MIEILKITQVVFAVSEAGPECRSNRSCQALRDVTSMKQMPVKLMATVTLAFTVKELNIFNFMKTLLPKPKQIFFLEGNNAPQAARSPTWPTPLSPCVVTQLLLLLSPAPLVLARLNSMPKHFPC